MIKKYKYIWLMFLAIIVGVTLRRFEANTKMVEPKTIEWSKLQVYYLKNMEEAITMIDSLAMYPAESAEAKDIFKSLRSAFKKAEPYASYLNPDVGHRANGPALPIFKEDTGKVLAPFGLQKIEESIYDGGVPDKVYKNEIYLTKGLLVNLKKNIEKRVPTVERFFIATHQQLLRIISLGISGFDTPVSHLGIGESITSLESLQEVYEISIRPIILDKNSKLDQAFISDIEKAISFIHKNADFDTFDRFTFIRDYMNPITRDWVAIRKQGDLWGGANNKPFNFDAPTFFESNSFNMDYFMPATNRDASKAQIALGEKLFHEPKLSAAGTMACVSCHNPKKAYADGLVTNTDNRGNDLERNTPSLLNAGFQQSYFWDGRSSTLMDQISSVFTNEKEFDRNVHEFSTEILKDTVYHELFENAFGKIPTKNVEIIKSISSYVATLNDLNSKFDRNIRGEEDTFSEEEKLGMNLFMGKALCATCHFMPLTNGTVPPFFNETEKEVIGVPETAQNNSLDDDLGYYWKFNEELQRGMFKTPTVRNSELTAPYMHNGVYATLEEVIDFYNKGGGGGMGFDLEYQTLPFDELKLTDVEQKSLVAFIKTLSDGDVKGY